MLWFVGFVMLTWWFWGFIVVCGLDTLFAFGFDDG